LSAGLPELPVSSSSPTADCNPDMPNSRGNERIRLFHTGKTEAPIKTPV
jgi:hypothetical protein